MGSLVIKYKGLKFLAVLAFVIAVYTITVAENGNEDSKQQEVSTTVVIPDTNNAVNEDSKQQEASTTVAMPDTNNAVNEDSKQQEASTTVAMPDMNNAVNEDSKQQEVSTTVAMPDTNNAVNEDPKLKDVSTALKQRMLKTISVDFRNTPIEDVIRIMAEQANVNIIKSPAVIGNVTATLTNVPLAEALDNILTAHGYAYVASENMIRVAPADEITEKSERLVNKIYRITYADVEKVESALQKFISKRGSISSNTGSSNIIVTDTETKIKAIDTFIDEIDRITPQILVEARIYDVTTTEGFDIGAEWTGGLNNPITSSTNTQVTNDMISTYTKDETTKTTATAWQESDAGLASGTESYAYRKSNPFIGGNFNSDTAGTIRLGLLDTITAELTLNILRTQVGAKLLANPRILVLDNESASFEIVSEIPYTESSETSAGGSMTSIKFKNVGVKLNVTPHVTRDGMIRLHIVPEFGVVTEAGDKAAESDLGTVPTVDTRKIDTKTLVEDGQTVVIGGLRKRTVSQDITKVPLLGDVPILGKLFTDVTEEVETNELIIFITPRVVIKPTLSPNETNGLEATKFGGPKVTYTGDEKADKPKESEK